MGVALFRERSRTDFFISHAGRDTGWAEWLAWQLQQAGYTFELDVWDWAPGELRGCSSISDLVERQRRAAGAGSAEHLDVRKGAPGDLLDEGRCDPRHHVLDHVNRSRQPTSAAAQPTGRRTQDLEPLTRFTAGGRRTKVLPSQPWPNMNPTEHKPLPRRVLIL
jgi:hypothetical protein